MSSALATPLAPAQPTDDAERLYAALVAHDARYDGRFFVGVTSTGVYCRPICRVRTPQRRNCRFFAHAAGAEAAGFRPCLRCRPELAPGLSLADSSRTLAHQAAALMDRAARSGQAQSMPALAQRLGVTDRHLRRIFAQTHGVSPLAYWTTRRLLQAKQLLTDTDWPVTEVALACGFASLRRFNDAFATHYRLTPSQLRRDPPTRPLPAPEPLTVHLSYRPPYDVRGMRRFWASRALAGLEQVQGTGDEFSYMRGWRVCLQGAVHAGWTQVRLDTARCAFQLRISPGLVPALGWLIERHREALDLDADPAQIDPVIARLGLPPCPGLRLPGAWDGWETAVRVILGQQVSVTAARTLALRLLHRFGVPLAPPDAPPSAGLTHTFPDAQALATAPAEALGALGIVRQRVGALQALARAVCDGHLQLDAAAAVEPTLAQLRALPGVGEWTAQLVAMRVLQAADAFPSTDIGLLNAMGTRDVRAVEAQAEAWRPCRAYAVIRWWQTLEKDDA